MVACSIVDGRVSTKDNVLQSRLRDLDEQEGQYDPQGMDKKSSCPKTLENAG